MVWVAFPGIANICFGLEHRSFLGEEGWGWEVHRLRMGITWRPLKNQTFSFFKFRASLESHIFRNVWGARNVMKNQTGALKASWAGMGPRPVELKNQRFWFCTARAPVESNRFRDIWGARNCNDLYRFVLNVVLALTNYDLDSFKFRPPG